MNHEPRWNLHSMTGKFGLNLIEYSQMIFQVILIRKLIAINSPLTGSL